MKTKKQYAAPNMKVYHIEANQMLCMSGELYDLENGGLDYGGLGNGLIAE